jgi:hypothetical protein
MGQILDTVISFFQQDQWAFAQLEGQAVLQMAFEGVSGQWTCFAHAREEEAQFLFYSMCPVRAPEDKRMAVAEFITRANYGLAVGNFELDFEDGEIRFKTSVDMEGFPLSPAALQPLVYGNVAMMDTYLPGILSVIYGGVSPAEAIAQIEG